MDGKTSKHQTPCSHCQSKLYFDGVVIFACGPADEK